MKIKVTHNDRELELELTIDGLFDITDWDNQELARLESQIGADEMGRWFRREQVEIPVFEMINTLVWCRLSSNFPGLSMDGFRFKLGPLIDAIREMVPEQPAQDPSELEASLAGLSDAATSSE